MILVQGREVKIGNEIVVDKVCNIPQGVWVMCKDFAFPLNKAGAIGCF